MIQFYLSSVTWRHPPPLFFTLTSSHRTKWIKDITTYCHEMRKDDPDVEKNTILFAICWGCIFGSHHPLLSDSTSSSATHWSSGREMDTRRHDKSHTIHLSQKKWSLFSAGGKERQERIKKSRHETKKKKRSRSHLKDWLEVLFVYL